MKKIVTSSISTLLVACSAFATGVTFNAEVDQIIVNGDPQNHADRDSNNLNALGFFVSNSNFASFIGEDVWSGSSVTTDDYGRILSFLNFNGLGGAAAIGEPPIAVLPVFSGAIDSGSAGNHAVFIIHDGDDINSLGVGNYFGIVTTTFQTVAQGSPPVGFTGANQWDTTLIGAAGSLSLAQISAVPEPSAYAAIAGLLALGWVATRRRK